MQPRNAYLGLYFRYIMYFIIVHNRHSGKKNIFLSSLGFSFNLEIWRILVMYPVGVKLDLLSFSKLESRITVPAS